MTGTFRYILVILIASAFLQCYSFKGIVIPDEVDTFEVPYVEMTTPDAPPSINIDFQDKLIQKITRESRLVFQDVAPDVTMKATISDYIVESLGANSQNNVDANRLKISVRIEFTDSKDEERNWKKTFSQNREFDAGVNLLSVQDDLIEQIFDDIVEDIFMSAFTNW